MEAPSQSPAYYWHLAKAAREGHPNDFLSNVKPRTECLKTKITLLSRWQFRLFENQETGELIVTFRGTDNFQNCISDVGILIAPPKKTVKKMESVIKKWQNEHGGREITAYVGHSAGGYFATHVNKGDNSIFRITFNGFKCTRGDRNWNLRTDCDPLSSDRKLGGIRSRYFTVCPGHHALNDFAGHIDHLDWQKIANSDRSNSGRYEMCMNLLNVGKQLSELLLPLETISKSEEKEKEKEEEKERENSVDASYSGNWPTVGNQLIKQILPLDITSKSEEKEKETEKEKENERENSIDTSYRFDNEVLAHFFQLLGGSRNVLFAEMRQDVKEILNKYQRETDQQGKSFERTLDLFQCLSHKLMGIEEAKSTPYVNLAKNLFSIYQQGCQLYQATKTFNEIKNNEDWSKAIAAFGGISGVAATFVHPAFTIVMLGIECYQIYSILFSIDNKEEKNSLQTPMIDTTSYFRSFIDNLGKGLSELENQQTEYYLSVRGEIDAARNDIEEAVKEISLQINELKRWMEEKSDHEKKIEFIAEIQKRHSDFKYEVLRLRKPSNYEKFLLDFNAHLKRTIEPLWNGLVDGESRVNHSEIVKSPQYFTGLLAEWINLSKVPNYYLFTEAVHILLKAFKKNENNKDSLEEVIEEAIVVGDQALKKNENKTDSLKEVIDEAIVKGNRLLRFMETGPRTFIDKVIKARDELIIFLKDFHQQIEKRSKHRICSIEDIWKKTENILNEDLIGQSKFFLSSFLKEEVFFKEEFDGAWPGVKTLIDFCEARYLVSTEHFQIREHDLFGLGRWLMGQKRDLKRNKEISAKMRSYGLRSLSDYQTLNEGSYPDWVRNTFGTWSDREKEVLRIFKKTIDSPLLSEIMNEDIGKERYFFQCYVHLDWCIREKIGEPFETRTEYPNSIITKNDLANIPYVDHTYKYDDIVRFHIRDYIYAVKERDFLDSKTDFKNLFGENLEHTVLIPALNRQLIPLAFPNELLDYWKERLSLKDSLLGYFIHRYKFDKSPDKKNYQLSLIFDLVSIGHILPQRYISIVVAEFDELTVESFCKITIDNEGKINRGPLYVNEFLLQAMYPVRNKAYRWCIIAGLPGNQSYRLENGIVASKELPFVGLFSLLKRYPGSMLKFNSAEYNEFVIDDLEKLIKEEELRENEKPREDVKNLKGKEKLSEDEKSREDEKNLSVKQKWLPSAIINHGKDYFEINRDLRNHMKSKLIRKDDFHHILEQNQVDERLKSLKETYTEAYNKLLAYCRLVSNRNESDLRLLIWEALDLPTPQIVEKWNKSKFQENVEKFQYMLREKPSENYLELQECLQKLKSFA